MKSKRVISVVPILALTLIVKGAEEKALALKMVQRVKAHNLSSMQHDSLYRDTLMANLKLDKLFEKKSFKKVRQGFRKATEHQPTKIQLAGGKELFYMKPRRGENGLLAFERPLNKKNEKVRILTMFHIEKGKVLHITSIVREQGSQITEALIKQGITPRVNSVISLIELGDALNPEWKKELKINKFDLDIANQHR